MRRLLMVSAVAALMAAMMVVISAPAMANDFNFGHRNHDVNDFNFGRLNDVDDLDDFDNVLDAACIGVVSGGRCIGVDRGFGDFVDFDGFANRDLFDNGNLNNCDFIGFANNGDALFRC